MLNTLALIVGGAVLVVLGILGWLGRLGPPWQLRIRPIGLVDNHAAGPPAAIGGAVGLLGGLFSLMPNGPDWILIGGLGMLALLVIAIVRGLYATHKAAQPAD